MNNLYKINNLLKITALFCIIFLIVLAAYVYVRGYTNQKGSVNQGLLLVGHFAYASKPLLLFINPVDFSVTNIDVSTLNNVRVGGIHEARPFMFHGKQKLALGTYTTGGLLIVNSTDQFAQNLTLDYQDVIPEPERGRAVFVSDLNDNETPQVVVGTRPSGILKYYQYNGTQWKDETIDTVGAAIHDVIIIDTDGDSENEIIASTSTVTSYMTYGLPLKTPQILQYRLTANGWKKEILWEPPKPIIENGLYAHARYLVVGDFDGVDNRELVTGIKNELGLRSLLRLTWDGSSYTQFSQDINKGIAINGDILVSGDIDDDGKRELLMPTLTADALLLYTWQKDTWERQVLTKNLIDEHSQNEIIIAMAMLETTSGGFKKIVYVTAQNAETAVKHRSIDDIGKLYVLQFNAQHNQWERTLVNTVNFPLMESWGMFPMTQWNIYK